jgi:ChpA-C
MSNSVSIKRSVQVAALTVAFTASGSAFALAGTGPSTSGDHSILGGNQIGVPISVPVNVCGNALALLGDAFGACQGGASTSGGSGGGNSTTSGGGSILGGNQAAAPISVPINVCGNSIAVLGGAASGCQGGASTGGSGGSGGGRTSGGHSVGGGNQVGVPVSVPVDVCGISAAGLGQASSGCQGGASTGGAGGSGGGSTSGGGSIGGGNQVGVPIKAPVSVCGVSIGILGTGSSKCQGGSSTTPPPGHHHHHMPPPPPGHHHHHHHVPPCHHHHAPPAHHHGGSGATVTSHKVPPSASVSGASSLPITGANFAGLLALAGGAIAAGAGALAFAAKRGLLHGLFAVTRRAAAAVR